jgi:phosphopantothenoylcysteine decarboxylase / phosphopantothenate---cysteine ligase
MKVALGITGGIAAYKAAELVRVLQGKGIGVQVVMTRHACEFVRPLTFAALSGHKVITEMFGEAGGDANVESAIEHIAVAQSVDLLVIAPATANTLAKFAHGLADDFLSTLFLAINVPVVVAPAMNVNMWEHTVTRENVETLRKRGVTIVPPDEGYLACGMTGAGRLASIDAISKAVFDALGIREDLIGETMLVTGGPTEEPLDAVRFISNRSSGKMGYAIAEAARRRGAKVILVSGPTKIDIPVGVEFARIHTADEMADAVLSRLPEATAVVMAAAVADFAPAEVRDRKIKKREGVRSIRLKPTRDILQEISRRKQSGQIVVGFAAETDQVVENAKDKLKSKKLDLIVANDVTKEGAGFDADTNIVTLVFRNGNSKALDKMSKSEVADCVLDEVVEIRRARS